MPDAFHEISRLLTSRPRREIKDASRTPASVLVPLFLKEGRLHLLLTVRTEVVATHKGQIAFPGGVREAGDAWPEDTALREAEEELGLDPKTVEILGLLDDVFTLQSRFTITPAVARIPWPCVLKPAPAEVAGLLEVPVDDLRVPGVRTEEPLAAAGPVPDPPPGHAVPKTFPVYLWKGSRIWGATARMVGSLMEVIS